MIQLYTYFLNPPVNRSGAIWFAYCIIIIVYGPKENKTKKDEFWEKLQEVYVDRSSLVLIVGDLNARVGNDMSNSNDAIGRFGETTKNRNGQRLIRFCMQNNLSMMNTYFHYKDNRRAREK